MRLSVPAIRKVVEKFYGISEKDMRGPRRTRKLARPRQIAMYLARELTPASLPRIGTHYGRDHTTVLHACRVVAKRLAQDPALNDDISHFRAVLTGAPLVIVKHPKYGESSITSVVIYAEPADSAKDGSTQAAPQPQPYDIANAEENHQSQRIGNAFSSAGRRLSAAKLQVKSGADPEIPDFLRRSKRA